MKTVALHNLGCKVNAYEADGMLKILRDVGYKIVPFESDADIYIVNTCSVTNIADKKSRQVIHRVKREHPKSVVVAAGCFVQTAKEKALEDESIDLIVGNNQKKDIALILDEYFKTHQKGGIPSFDNDISYEEMGQVKAAGHTRATVKVEDGCNRYCSYCVIPYARGPVRSRKLSDIKKEALMLADCGFKEIVLTGINLSLYEDEKAKLQDVVVMLNGIAGIERIRLGSLDPDIVTDDFVNKLSGCGKLCRHFHLSMQSGCDDTLKRMNRRYTSREYYEKCQILREAFDKPAITTDVIVGFPGETKEEYEKSKAFVRKVGFSRIHVFPYSPREGTVAAKMDHQVQKSVKSERCKDLIALGKCLSGEYMKGRIGKNAKVLIEEKREINGRFYPVGYTDDYIKTAVTGENIKEGDLVDVVGAKILNDEIMLANSSVLY